MKDLAGPVKRPTVAGNASGHSLQEGEALSWRDGVAVSVYGAEEGQVVKYLDAFMKKYGNALQ